MKPNSRVIIHLGINFILAPCPNLTAIHRLAFQQAILEEGLEYQRVTNQADKFIITRETQPPLEITIAPINQPQIGQLLIVSSQPKGSLSLELFIAEAEAVARAFLKTWPRPVYQILSNDLAIKELHETSGEHAFQEIWEERLHQSQKSLDIFNRPILGGGLRFVMPPLQSDPAPKQIEIKIESFLKNTNNIYIELQVSYPEPAVCNGPFEIGMQMKDANQFLEQQVYSFITGE